MTDGFAADVSQIRAHITHLESARARLDSARAAGAAITADDAAFGLLCGWMSGVLRARQERQADLVAYVAENLRLAADALHHTALDYERSDDAAADRIRRSGGH